MYTSAGVPSGGAYIFLKMLWNIKEIGNPIVVLDSGHSKFRTEVYPDYKKKAEKTVEEKDEQSEQAFNATFSILTKLLPNMGVPVMKIDGEEADDVAYVLATYLKSKNTENIFMVSDDADWEQNVNLGATVFKAMKNEYVTPANFLEKHGFDPKYFALWKSLIGDGSDNIPGIKGIGPVSATKIINQLKTPELSSLLEWSNSGETKLHKKIKEGFAIVKRNTLLIDFKNIQISQNAVIDSYLQASHIAKINFEYVKNKFHSLEFNTLSNWLVYLGQKI